MQAISDVNLKWRGEIQFCKKKIKLQKKLIFQKKIMPSLIVNNLLSPPHTSISIILSPGFPGITFGYNQVM